MPPTKRPPDAFWSAAIRAIKASGTTRDPEAVAADLWYHKMSRAQRRKWLHGTPPQEITSFERADVDSMARQDRAARILERVGERPELAAMAAAAVAGALVPDVEAQFWEGLVKAWNDFWAAIPTPWGTGPVADIGRFAATAASAYSPQGVGQATTAVDDFILALFGQPTSRSTYEETGK